MKIQSEIERDEKWKADNRQDKTHIETRRHEMRWDEMRKYKRGIETRYKKRWEGIKMLRDCTKVNSEEKRKEETRKRKWEEKKTWTDKMKI